MLFSKRIGHNSIKSLQNLIKNIFLMLSLDIYEFNIIFPWSLLLSDPSFKSEALQAKQEKSNRII